MFLNVTKRGIPLGMSAMLILSGFLSFDAVGAYQIRDGNVMRVMQSGNPGTSASYQISAKLRIEGGGVIVDDNAGALGAPPVVSTSSSIGGSSATINRIVTVCKADTGQQITLFPTGNDQAYSDYQSCSGDPYQCAEQWAWDKGYVPCSDIATPTPVEPTVPAEGNEEPFRPSAPQPIPGVVNSPVDLLPEVTELITPTVTAETPIVANIAPIVPVTAEREILPLESTNAQNFQLNIETGEVVFPVRNYHMVAPDESLVPRAPDPTVDREHYTCVRVPGFVIYNDWWKWLAYRLFFVLVMLLVIIFLLAFWVFLLWKKSPKNHQKRTKKKSSMKEIKKWFVFVLLCLVVPFSMASAQSTTTPQLLIYEGELLDDTATPLAGNYTFRFSFWANADFEATDVIAGAINASAVDYYSWNEAQTQALDTGGRFSFQVGSVTPFVLGMFDQNDLYLQVEVKVAGAPDSTYEVIDVDSTDLLVDRKVIASVPFAFNANKLDYRELGYGPGEIPYIDDVTGLLPGSVLPSFSTDGTDSNTFTIDQDGSAVVTDSLTLQFGDSISETLAWNGLSDQFEFSDDVNIAGNLTVTGTINGVAIGPQNVAARLSPRYANSIFEKDGVDNLGSMYEEIDTLIPGVERHVLRWSTEQVALQDYDILVRYALPHNFDSWLAPAIELDYRTQSVITDSHIDLTVLKEGSAVDQIGGVGLNLVDNAWDTGTFSLTGPATWTAGDVVWIKMKMHSRSGLDPRVGDIVLNYVIK